MRLLLWAAVTVCAHAATQPGLSCASCHKEQSVPQAATGMAHALRSGTDAPILRSHPSLTFRQGPYSYTIERSGNQSTYTVSDGRSEWKAPIAWAFGLGAAGQTYVVQRNGAWYETRVSYYKDIDALDLTVGARPDVPRSLEEAFGREQSEKGANECFNCHATGVLSGGALHVEALTPGVQCVRCHNDGPEHMASLQSPDGKPKRAVKLGALSAEEIADFCGQCHRTWATIASQGPHNITNVRFQPYRLANSKCYDSSENRIRCISCHDPHVQSEAPPASYDRNCRACHNDRGDKPGAKMCSVAQSNCVSCHMPKVEIKEAHNKFTDHWIRIARPGDPVPN